MLINGTPVTGDKLLKDLQTLPSSFPEYKAYKVNNYFVTPEAQILNSKGMNAFRKGKYKDAKDLFNQALEVNKVFPQEDNLFLSNYYTNMGHIYLAEGNNSKAAEYFNKNTIVYLQNELYEEIENNYKRIVSINQQLGVLPEFIKTHQNMLQSTDREEQLKGRLALGAVEKLRGNNLEAIEHYSIAYSLRQGHIDYETHRVEQHEVGFSAEEKIGTDNIQQCVVVILRDTISKKTALAHFDKYTNPKSISDIVAKFPPDTKLETYLIGGRDRGNNSKMVSDTNIQKVTDELMKHNNINIKSADIGDKGSPSAIVFDPKTGQLSYAVPGKNDATTPLRMASIGIAEYRNSQGLSPLNFAFDLTASKTIGIRNLSDAQKEEVIKSYIKFNRNPVQGASQMWQANLIAEPYYKAVTNLIKEDAKLKQIIVDDIKNEVYTILANKLQGMNFNNRKRLMFEKQLTNLTEHEFQNGNINLIEIKGNINKNIDQYTNSKTLGEQITNPKNWKNLIKSIFTGKKHISIDIKGISNLFTEINNNLANKPKMIKGLSAQDKTNLDKELKKANIAEEVDYKHYHNKQEVQNNNKIIQKKQNVVVRE